jgi:hypothetical protein
MKSVTTLSLAAMTALLIGCGGGGGSSDGPTGTTSSNGTTSSVGNSTSSVSDGNIVNTYAPVTTAIACDPAVTTTAPYTDYKYAAEGAIGIQCDDTSSFLFSVFFKNGGSTIDLQSIHAEVYVDEMSLRQSKTTYDYTPEAFTITYYHGRDILGNLVQESCTRTYNPTELSAMEPYQIEMLITAPYFGNLSSEVSTTCDDSLFTFGDFDTNAVNNHTIVTKSNIVFTDTLSGENKIAWESVATYPQ